MEAREGRVYVIELCSGEHRRWRFLGVDSGGVVSWRDEETGRVFSEASVMYAWRIVAEE